jgi:hypothetical protein
MLISVAAFALASCTKTNNNTTVIAPLPAFTVNGIHDITLVNGGFASGLLPITVAYSDSVQQTVTLSLSALPAAITIDTSWVTTGIPTFNTDLIFMDSTSDGAAPGTYPMTITATGSLTGKKVFPFNLKIVAATSCTTGLTGKYQFASSSCTGIYADSVYADPTVVNKIWFVSTQASSYKFYGRISCANSSVTIPGQTINGTIYSGSGYFSSAPKNISYTLSNIVTGSCSFSMR